MALVPINVGFIVNDGTGDDLRTAFLKINQNFEELEIRGGQANTISNIGTGVGLYKEKIGVDLRLKSLKAGDGITLTNGPTEVTIENSRNVFVTVNANTGTLTASTTNQSINIVGGTGITTSITGSTLTITNTGNVVADTSPSLGGNLDLNGFNIIGGAGTNISADVFSGFLVGDVIGNVTGNLIGLVNGIDITTLNNQLFLFDFGLISPVITSPAQWLLYTTIIDMGTILNPDPAIIEGGSIV